MLKLPPPLGAGMIPSLVPGVESILLILSTRNSLGSLSQQPSVYALITECSSEYAECTSQDESSMARFPQQKVPYEMYSRKKHCARESITKLPADYLPALVHFRKLKLHPSLAQTPRCGHQGNCKEQCCPSLHLPITNLSQLPLHSPCSNKSTMFSSYKTHLIQKAIIHTRLRFQTRLSTIRDGLSGQGWMIDKAAYRQGYISGKALTGQGFISGKAVYLERALTRQGCVRRSARKVLNMPRLPRRPPYHAMFHKTSNRKLKFAMSKSG